MLIFARVVAWNKLIKKSLIDDTKIFFPKGLQYEDVCFFYKLLPHIKKFAFVKKPYIHYIQRKNSISNKQNEKTEDIFKVFDEVFEYYKKEGFYEEYIKELEYTYCRYLLCSSLKRISKISDNKVRKNLLDKTWNSLNEKFPNWKKNEILYNYPSMKNRYIKTVNSKTFKIYANLLRILKNK